MTPAKLFSSSNVPPCSVFDNIVDAKLISTLRSVKSVPLLANYTKVVDINYRQLTSISMYIL